MCVLIIDMTVNVAAMSYLQLQNPLLNATGDDKACHMDGLVLT